VKLLEYRHAQVLITAKRWKQRQVGWFLESGKPRAFNYCKLNQVLQPLF